MASTWRLLETLVRDHGWFPASTLAPMPVGSPFGVEGYKTIAFEMILESRAWRRLSVVFVPVGGGDGLYGLFKGWREFLEIGLADRMPRFVACQAAGANAVVRAVRGEGRAVSPRSRMRGRSRRPPEKRLPAITRCPRSTDRVGLPST